jgi:hypothetical protein
LSEYAAYLYAHVAHDHTWSTYSEEKHDPTPRCEGVYFNGPMRAYTRCGLPTKYMGEYTFYDDMGGLGREGDGSTPTSA